MSVTIGTIPHIPDYTFGDIEFHVLNNTNTSLTLNTTKSIFGFAVSGMTGTNYNGYGVGSVTGTNLGNNQYSLSQTTDTVLYNGSRSVLRSVAFGEENFDLQNRFSSLPILNASHTSSSTLILYMVPLNSSSGFSNGNGLFVSSVSNIARTVPIDERNVTITDVTTRLYSAGRPVETKFRFTSFLRTSGVLVIRSLYSRGLITDRPYNDKYLVSIKGSQIAGVGDTFIDKRRQGTAFITDITTLNSPGLDAIRQAVLFISDNEGTDSVSSIVDITMVPFDQLNLTIENLTISPFASLESRVQYARFTFTSFPSTSGSLYIRRLYYGSGLNAPYTDVLIANVRGSAVTRISSTPTTITTRSDGNRFISEISNVLTEPGITVTRQCIVFISNNGGNTIISNVVDLPSPVTNYALDFYINDQLSLVIQHFFNPNNNVFNGEFRTVTRVKRGSFWANPRGIFDVQNNGGRFSVAKVYFLNWGFSGGHPYEMYHYLIFIPANGDPHFRFPVTYRTYRSKIVRNPGYPSHDVTAETYDFQTVSPFDADLTFTND